MLYCGFLTVNINVFWGICVRKQDAYLTFLCEQISLKLGDLASLCSFKED